MRRMVYATVALVVAFGVLAGPAAAERNLNQRFTLVFQNSQDEAKILASGPVSGAGTLYFVDATDNPDGSFIEHYRAEFRSGTFSFKIVGRNESFDLDPATCVLRMVNTGTYSIADGTGAYTGISGEGTFTFRLTAVLERGPEGCSEEGNFVGVAKLSGISSLAA